MAAVSCGFMLTGMALISSTDGEARIIRGIITGIGYTGGGAILKDRDKVAGAASAASIYRKPAPPVLRSHLIELISPAVHSALKFGSLFIFVKIKDNVHQDESDDGQDLSRMTSKQERTETHTCCKSMT